MIILITKEDEMFDLGRNVGWDHVLIGEADLDTIVHDIYWLDGYEAGVKEAKESLLDAS